MLSKVTFTASKKIWVSPDNLPKWGAGLSKHVKSILIGEDGSTIKSIAFNATENELGGYLLKKHNKSFNIAGKLSLNEWRGQSNVEFIIDDISVNKTFKNTVPSSIG